VSFVSPALVQAAGSPAPQAQAATKDKNWKDRAEYDLYTSITTETNSQKKLDLLTQWTQKYPTTDFKSERATLYLTTYAALNRPKDAIASAKDLVALDPKDFTGLYYMTYLTLQALDTSPGALDDSEKAANGLIGALNDKFAAANKPATASDADWTKARNETEALAHTTLGWVALQRKDNAKAEEEFTKSLQLNPGAGQVSYWLGTAILAEKDPAKQAAALYDFARAAAYDGPGALAPEGRQSVQQYLEKVYASYHGSKDGLDALEATAKTAALPPPDFKILSTEDIEKKNIDQQNELAKKNPSLGLWLNIRTALSGADGEKYFTDNMKGAQTPAFTGKLISATPETKPKTLVLAIADGKTPDCTVTLDTPLPGKAEGDTFITFQGIPQSYTANPFTVTFNAEKASVKGWTGKEAPAHHPVRRRTAAQ
jgi:hypothetical protein